MARLGPALGLSLLAHALALAGLVHLLHLARLSDSPAAVSRKREAVMSVSLRQVPPPTPRPSSAAPRLSATPALARPREQAHRVEATHQAMAMQAPVHATAQAAAVVNEPPAPATATATEPAVPPSPAAATQPPETQPAPRPSARFANLFAPVIGRPLGRGRWQPRQPMQPIPEQTPAMQMAQALAAARDALNQRTAQINAVLQQVPLHGRQCLLRIDLPARAAHIQCEQAQDHARLQSMLEGLVRSVPLSQALPDGICLQASPHQLAWATCPEQDSPASASIDTAS